MSRLLARVERLENANDQQTTAGIQTTKEEEQAWLDWKAQEDEAKWQEFRALFRNPLPDLEYEKLTTDQERAEYTRRKFEELFESDVAEDRIEYEARIRKQKEDFIRNLRAGN